MKIKDLKPGDVIRFNYKGGTDPSPIILFLDYWQGKIHGMNMNYMSQAQKRYFYLLFKIKYAKKKTTPLEFYNSEIKGRLKQNAYRTYNPKNMNGTTKVNTVIIKKGSGKASTTSTKWRE